MGAQTKLFIVDDHHMVIEGIYSLLHNEPGLEWMGHATNGESCLAFLQNHQPDILFLDISLPGMSGIELCRIIAEKYPSIFIIGLSTFNQQSFIHKMMESGAAGYVLKNATKEELLRAIDTVMHGRTYFSPEAALTAQRRETEGAPIITRREKEVLELIAEGLTNQEIAKQLFISPTTVDTHRKNLLTKFEVRNVASLIRVAIRLQVI
jgi:DNA-binding NarL/FixJ family response regulator